jgi:NitT/TauT family transport system substrate-binding protein
VAAATLPEPLTTLATAIQEGTALLSDSDIGFVPTVVAFNQAVLDARPQDVAAFLSAYERAVEAINRDPETYRDVEIQVPDPVRATYKIPEFVPARVPSPEEVQDVMDWMVEQGLIDEPIAYETIVDGSFLPQDAAN